MRGLGLGYVILISLNLIILKWVLRKWRAIHDCIDDDKLRCTCVYSYMGELHFFAMSKAELQCTNS